MASKDNKKLATKLQKSYFDVLGLCCSSEVPLVENILNSLDGIDEFSVIVPTKTVIVVHDNLLLSQLQIVTALNRARLEANVRVTGETDIKQKLPSPYAVASGVLLLLAFLKYVCPPLKWLALGAVGVGIVPVLLKGFASMRNLRLDVNILVIIAVVGTVAMRDYIEAGTIVFLFTVGEWLESRASYKANAVMSSLISLAPQRAVIAETGEEVDADEVKVNTVLAVKAGEVIPIDGVVVDGKCEVDEKTLTGESFPVSKQKDSTVWAGTINLNGYISVKTTALATDCVVAKMTKLVEEAQNSKSSAQRFIDKCSQYYTPAIIILAAAFALVPFVFKVHNRKHWFYLALVFLVSGCPCALVLSTPVVTFCALTKAAAAGLLIKGGNYLEILAKVKTVAFDKTGTITRGEFAVTDFQSLSNDISLETLLYWVSSIESESSHPMAAALVDYARSRSIDPKPDNVEEFQNYPGEGIHGKIDGKHIYIGNRKIALRTGSATVPTADGGKMSGRTVGYIYCGATHTGIFSLSDACRTGAAQAIANLTLLGIKTAMLTGDNKAAAMQAQEQLGHTLEEVHAELLPEDKARIIGKYKKGGPTAMVGDGLNDTPALATADIGISMGISGSALASETGHVILMSNDIGKVPKAIQLARKAQRKVVENVILSITTKAAIIALAFAGHPLVWAAVLADVGTCLLVILNSMMLLGVTHSHTGTCCKSSGKPHIHKHGHKHSSHNHKHCCSSQTVEDACVAEKSQCCSSSCHSSQSHTHSCSGTTCKGDRQDKCRDAHDIHESKHCGQGACKTDHNEAEKTDPRHQCCSGPHHFSKHTEGDGPEDHKHCHHGTHKGSHDHSDNAFDLEEGGKISHEGSNHHQHQNKGCCDHGHHHHMELHPDSLEGHKHCHQSHDHSNLSHHDHPDHAHDHSTHPHGVHDHDHSDQAHDLEEGRKMSHSDHRESEHHDQNIALTHIIIDSPANNVAPCCSHSHHHHMDHSKKCCSGH